MARSYYKRGATQSFINKSRKQGRFPIDGFLNRIEYVYSANNIGDTPEDENPGENPGTLDPVSGSTINGLLTAIRTRGITDMTINLTKAKILFPAGRLKVIDTGGIENPILDSDDGGVQFAVGETRTFSAKENVATFGGKDILQWFSDQELIPISANPADWRFLGFTEVVGFDDTASIKFNTTLPDKKILVFNETNSLWYKLIDFSPEIKQPANNRTIEVGIEDNEFDLDLAQNPVWVEGDNENYTYILEKSSTTIYRLRRYRFNVNEGDFIEVVLVFPEDESIEPKIKSNGRRVVVWKNDKAFILRSTVTDLEILSEKENIVDSNGNQALLGKGAEVLDNDTVIFSSKSSIITETTKALFYTRQQDGTLPGKIFEIDFNTLDTIRDVDMDMDRVAESTGFGGTFDKVRNKARLYACNDQANELYEYDPVTLGLLKVVNSPGGDPQGIGGTDGRLFSVDRDDSLIFEHDLETLAVIRQWNAPSSNTKGIGGSRGRLWVTNGSTREIYELDINNNMAIINTGTVPGIGVPEDIGGAGGRLYVVETEEFVGHLYEVDQDTLIQVGDREEVERTSAGTGGYTQDRQIRSHKFDFIILEQLTLNAISEFFISEDDESVLKINGSESLLEINRMIMYGEGSKITLDGEGVFISENRTESSLNFLNGEVDKDNNLYLGSMDNETINSAVVNFNSETLRATLPSKYEPNGEENFIINEENFSSINSKGNILLTGTTNDGTKERKDIVLVIDTKDKDGLIRDEVVGEDLEKPDDFGHIKDQPIFLSTSIKKNPQVDGNKSYFDYQVQRSDIPKFKNQDGKFVKLTFTLDLPTQPVNAKRVKLTFEAFTLFNKLELLGAEDTVLTYSLSDADFNSDWYPQFTSPIVSGTTIYWDFSQISEWRFSDAYWDAMANQGGWTSGAGVFLNIGEQIENADYIRHTNPNPLYSLSGEFLNSTFDATAGSIDLNNANPGYGLSFSDLTFDKRRVGELFPDRRHIFTEASKRQDYIIQETFTIFGFVENLYFSRAVDNERITLEDRIETMNGLIRGSGVWNTTIFDQLFINNNGGTLQTVIKNTEIRNWDKGKAIDKSYAVLAPNSINEIRGAMEEIGSNSLSTIQEKRIKYNNNWFFPQKITVPIADGLFSRLPQEVFTDPEIAQAKGLRVNSEIEFELLESSQVNRLRFNEFGGRTITIEFFDEFDNIAKDKDGNETIPIVVQTPNVARQPNDSVLDKILGF